MTTDEEGHGTGHPEVTHAEPTEGMPRWVKISLLVPLAVVVLFLLVQIVGGGEHGPGRHGGDDPPSSLVDEDGRGPSPVDHAPVGAP